jgi:hypothetical protein
MLVRACFTWLGLGGLGLISGWPGCEARKLIGLVVWVSVNLGPSRLVNLPQRRPVKRIEFVRSSSLSAMNELGKALASTGERGRGNQRVGEMTPGFTA